MGLDPRTKYGAMIDHWNEMNPDVQVNAIATDMDKIHKTTDCHKGWNPGRTWPADRFQIASWVARNAFLLDDFAKADGL